MLVLTRKVNEKLIIGGNVEVVVLEATKNSVRIGIKAPHDVQIFREEVYREIQNANKLSVDANLEDIDKIAPKVKIDKAKNFDLASKLISKFKK